MNNPFDQFDVVEPSAAQNNPFDQFDEPVRDADEVNAEINAAMAERQPAPDRNWGEVATDTGKALMGGFANLGGAAGQLVDVGARAATMGPRLMAEASDAVGLTDNLGQRLGDAVGAPGHAIQRITGDAANYWNAQKSDAMKAAQQKLQAAGDAGTGFMDEATETAKVLWENPMLLGDILAGSAPNLLIPGAAARGAGTIAARNALVKGGSEAAAKTAATKAATKAGIGAGGVLEGAAAGSETRRDVMQMTPEQLIAGSAAYGRLIEEGYDHKSAVEQIAFNAGLTAQAIVTPISMLMGAATGAGKVEAEFFTGQGVKNLFSAVAKEAVQETGQEAGAAFGGNVGTKLYADKDQRLTEGLGQGAVLGAAAGAGQTAGMRVTGGLVGAVANSNHEQGGTQQSNPELEPEPDNSVAAPKMPAPGDQVSWVTPNGEQPAIFAGEVEGPNGQPFAQISIDGVDSYVPMDQLQWGQTPRLLDATPESIEAELESGNVEAEAEFSALMGEAGAHREANTPGRENPFDQFDGIDYEPVSVGGTSLSLAPLESAQNEYEGAIEFETDQPPAIESLAGPVVDRINEHARQQEDDAAQEAYLNETAEPLSPAGPSLPDLMNRYAPDPSANATRTANPPRLDIEVQDARLKRPEYRAQLERMAEELVKGGGIGYIRDAHDRIVGRTPSINPEWFKSLNENPETTMSVEDVQAAIKKALAGEKLGVRQLRVVGAALDAFGDERGNYARELRAMRENARQDRRRAFEQWLEATNVPVDAEFEATVWPELPGDVYAETDYLPHLDMDSRAVTELMETADAFGVDWSAIDQALAEPDVTAQTRALTQLIWDARNEHRETTNQQAPRAGSAESEPGPLLGTTEALEKEPSNQAQSDQPTQGIINANETPVRSLDKLITNRTDTAPTEAQKEAGNYKKAHIKIQGLYISIENPRGSTRSGVDANGNPWSNKLHSHYGYIRNSTASDGEHIDVFIGPNPDSDKVFIVDQVNPDGTYDEAKVMIGFDSKLKARSGYKANYSNGWKVGPITSMSMDEFKDWLKNGDTTKPLKAENQKPDKDTLSAKSETATPSANQETAKQTLPAILTETKSQTLKKMAAEKGIKKGSPGYSDAMARLAEEYETEVDRAQAGLTFEQFNELNGDSPESINRQAHEALREEFGISEGAALYSGHERKTRNLQDRKSGIHQLQEPAADAGRGSQFDLFLHAGADKRKAYADIFGTIIKPRPITRINSATDSVGSIEELAHLLASIRKDPQESFYAVATDNKGKVLRIMQYTRGTANAASVYPLDVVAEAASIDNVHTLHLAHNHPSGKASASRADEAITKRIFEMLDGTGIRPGHHAIIAGTKWADGSLESGPAGTIEPRSRAAFSIPITQRRIVKRGSLGDPITSPDAALKATSNYTDALLLLDNQNAPVAAVTISAAEMSKLREGGRVNRILSAINTSNARAAIIKTDNKSAAKNLAAMLNSLNDINVLDWIDSEGSDRQRGGSVHDSSGPFFSLADRRTQGAVDTASLDQGAGTDVSGSGATVSHEEANKVIRRILAAIRRPDLTIKPVGDFSGFPAAVKDQAAREGHDGKDVQGVIHGNSIYLNLSALRDARHVEQVIFHELYGHYGIRQLFDLGTKQAMGRLYLAIGGAKGVNQIAARHNINLTPYARGLLKAEASGHHDRETSLAITAEELLAHLAQDNKPSVKRFAREAIGAIRTWLRSHGFLNLSNVSDNELFYLLKQARQVINTGTVSGQSGLLFALTAPSSARFSLNQLPPGTRKIIGDDPVLAGWTMLAQSDDVFQLPVSNKKMLTAIFKELEGERGMTAERADELALQNDYGAKMAWRVTTPNGEKAAIYQDGKSVWIDVSDLKQGEDGKRIYNAVANYAFNTDRVFIGDPAGLSDVALTRRLENMISSALKFGTTKHLWPHERQAQGNKGMGVPGIQWKDGNDAHNLRQMIDASYEATAVQFPKIRDLRYNQDKDRFEDTSDGNREFKRSDFQELAKAARRVQDSGRGGSSPSAGRTTLERAVLTNTLSRGTRSEVAGILELFSRLGSKRLTGPRNAILYSLSQDSEPRPQGGVSRSGADQTQTPEFKRWFGDSKVVDSEGKPLVVHHGTGNSFDVFSPDAAGKNTDSGMMGKGFYFASSPEEAARYARGSTPNVVPVYLSLKRPFEASNYKDFPAIPQPQTIEEMRQADTLYSQQLRDKLLGDGYDGVIFTRKDGSKEYVAFRPEQIKSALGNTGAFDPDNPDIRFSLRSDHRQTIPNPRPRPSAGVSVSEEGNSKAGSKTERPSNFQAPGTKVTPFQALMDKALRKVVDKMRPLLNTQSEIEKYTGRKIDESLDAYLSEEAFHGKTENDLRKLRENYVEPLAEYMAKHDISREELDLFLWAAHAPERNKQIAKINPDMPDGGSGMTTAKAVEVLKKAQSEGKLETLKGAAKFVYDALKHRRDLMKGALLEDGTVDAWEEVYKYYVPLKGQAQNEGGSSTPRIGRGFDIRGKESFRALGRSTMPESPALHAIRDTTETIIRFRKNEVGNVLLDLVQAYPNDDYWQVFDASHPEFERRLLKAEGKDRVGEAKVIDKSKYFITKKDGKEYYIKLHDQQLLDAMKNLGAEHLSGPLQAMAKVTRYLSSINTSLNPEFVISNFVRDIQAAVYNAMAEQDLHDGRIKGQKIVGKMVADVPVAIRAIKASLSGKQLDGKAGEWQKAFDQFRDDGAKTGWYDMKDLDGQAKDLERLILLSQKGIRSDIYRAGRATLNLIDDINTAIENGVRLAVYKNAVEAGVTRKQASSLAKNLTVNFNRKGEWGAVMNSLWMFTNAAIQGNKVFYRAMATMKANPDGTKSLNKAQKAAIVMTGLAIGLAVLNRAMAGEDDDGENWYDKVPEHIKERNIVIMKSAFGGEPGEYWSFMLPYGYNIFHVMGTELEAAYSNPKNAGKSALNILKAGVGSFVPISLAENEDAPPSITRTLAPSVVKPFADLDANKNFYGGDIFRENRFGVPKPDSHLSKRNTPESWKWAAEFLNEATGGSAYRSGKIDINPDKLDYIFKYYTGGVGAFASRTVDAGIKTSQGIELDAREIPFVRRLSGKVNHYPDQNRFYDRANEIGQLENEWRSLGGKERIAFYKEHGERIRLKGLAKATEKQLKRLRARRDAIESDASLTPREKDAKLKEIELQTKKQIDHFNKSWPKD